VGLFGVRLEMVMDSDKTVEMVGGYCVPIDMMDELQCDSCQ